MAENKNIEVILSPGLFTNISSPKPYVVVVVDIFRATTSICAALDYGVKAIIPVKRIRHARFLKRLGYTVAAERGGHKVRFAHLGNSATAFFKPELKGKEIVYSTTNGTKAIRKASGAKNIIIGSFVNLSAVARWLDRYGENVVIFCAGWKNKVNMEDTLFAGALSDMLINKYGFTTNDDSAKLAIDQWKMAKDDLIGYIEQSSHRRRLRHLVDDELLQYTFSIDKSNVVPVLKGYKVVPDNPKE